MTWTVNSDFKRRPDVVYAHSLSFTIIYIVIHCYFHTPLFTHTLFFTVFTIKHHYTFLHCIFLSTGEEMNFTELLKSFGLDMASVASALGIDIHTLNSMGNDELLLILTQ